jgi:hypothetical protein
MNKIIRRILGKKSILIRNVHGELHLYSSMDMTTEEVIDYLSSATVRLADPSDKLFNLKNREN